MCGTRRKTWSTIPLPWLTQHAVAARAIAVIPGIGRKRWLSAQIGT